MLPDLDGFALCRKIRDSGNFTPVIMLTARSDPDDRVTGLEAGADDYMVKPFELSELLARVQSMLRRRRWEQGGARPAGDGVLSFGRATVDFSSHTATVDGAPLALTRLELDLIRYFARNPGRTLSRKELLERVWGLRDYPNTRTVDNFMARLRRYFEVDPTHPAHFLSVRGVGYRFEPGGAA
jgi:DNA-binding response OmpR family regulator